MLPAAQKAAGGKPRYELAHIFQQYGNQYRQTHSLPLRHHKVMHAIERCRSAQLGGHLDQCDSCGYQHPAYNSCRNRHCPKCQSLAKTQWVEKQKALLLPTGAFHVVFTLPHDLNPLILCNKRVLLNLLFKTVSQTLMAFSHRHLKGTPVFTLVLHSRNQQLNDHFHLHCLFPRGALPQKSRELLGLRPDPQPASKKSTREFLLQFAGIDITRCPQFKPEPSSS